MSPRNRAPEAKGFQIQMVREPGLWRVAVAGTALLNDVAQIRAARMQTESDTLPVLVVDEGLTHVDTVAYGAFVQWAQASRNRNVGWATTLALETAGRMFQMGALNVHETVFGTEEAARAALDRGKEGQRVVSPRADALALDGLRHK